MTLLSSTSWYHFPPFPKTSMNDILLFLFQPEELERKCEKCQFPTATMRKTLLTMPRVFVLQVKRYFSPFVSLCYLCLIWFSRFESETYRVVKRHERVTIQTQLNFRTKSFLFPSSIKGGNGGVTFK